MQRGGVGEKEEEWGDMRRMRARKHVYRWDRKKRMRRRYDGFCVDDWDARGKGERERENVTRGKERKEGDEIRGIAVELVGRSVSTTNSSMVGRREGSVHESKRKGSEKEKENEKRRDEKGEDRNWRTRRRRSVVVSRATSYVYMHLFICNMRVCVRMHDEYIRGVSLALLRLITP